MTKTLPLVKAIRWNKISPVLELNKNEEYSSSYSLQRGVNYSRLKNLNVFT